jgi:hypothetical protein
LREIAKIYLIWQKFAMLRFLENFAKKLPTLRFHELIPATITVLTKIENVHNQKNSHICEQFLGNGHFRENLRQFCAKLFSQKAK